MREIASNINYSKERKRLSGSFFTPKCIADFLAAKMLEFCSIKDSYCVLDPATGDSSLLTSFKEIFDSQSKTYTFVGIDTDKEAIEHSSSIITDNAFFIETDALYPFGKKDWSEIETQQI